MRFTILQQDLLPSLAGVARSIGIRAQLPILANILLSVSLGKLKLSATNLEIGVVKSVSIEDGEDGEITIGAKSLVEMVSNLSGEKLEFSTAGEQLKIQSPSFFSVINGISALEFPVIPLAGKEAAMISPGVLIKALPQVAFAAAVDEGRPVLTGILTEIKDKKLQLVGTDGYRLAHKLIPIEEEAEFKTLVPRRTFEEVVRLLGEDKADLVKISTSDNENQIIFQFGNTEISSRLIEGQFPVWEKIIPPSFKTRVVVERPEFLKAVKLASVFSRSEGSIVKIKNQETKLILSSEAKELGSQQKELEIQGEGEAVEVAFNAKFLQDGLMVLNSSQVVLELSGSLSAAILKGVGEEGFQYIIMPVNLG